jgi:hypothetical protein
MICIKVYGSSKNRKLKGLLIAAAHHYLKQLMPKKRNVRITIQLIKDLALNERVFGDCYQCYRDDPDEDYIIRLHYDDSEYVMLITLAHEFVHLKQYDRNELRFYAQAPSAARWKGKMYKDYNYETAPWEVEANFRENALYDSFLESSGKL